ncbi:MAG: TerB family tellurite resistance protein [Planctomycetota bacterium]
MPTSDVELLSAACCIAAMDGEICDRESKALAKLKERAGVGEASFNAMVDSASNDQTFYERQFRYCTSEPERAVKLLFKVAALDGTVSMEERVMIRHFADKMNMPEAEFERIEAKYTAS